MFPSPTEIYEHLCKHIIGQDDAKKTLSVAVYNHYKRLMLHNSDMLPTCYKNNLEYINPDLKNVKLEKSNILMLGNTGTGKTYMIKQLADFIGVPCYIADMTKVTQSGYVGDDVESVLVGLLRETDYDLAQAQCGIVILDEIDKLRKADAGTSITRDVGGEGVQQSLLKIIEGSVVSVPPQGGRKHPDQSCIPFDTSNVLFIGLGAFEDIESIIARRLFPKSHIGFATTTTKKSKEPGNILSRVTHEDVKEFGMISEMVGRFPVLTYTNPLEEEDLVKILTEPQNSIVKQYQKLLGADNVKLSFDKKALKEIAKIALKSKTGARSLRGIMEKVLFHIMFKYSGAAPIKTVNLNITLKDVTKAA